MQILRAFISATCCVVLAGSLSLSHAAEWAGAITWDSAVEALDPSQEEMAELIHAMAPAFEYHCSSQGKTIILHYEHGTKQWHRDADGSPWFISPSNSWVQLKGVQDLEEQADQIAAFMPAHYDTTLEKISEGEVIAGLPTTHYRIVKSGFIRGTAEVWIHHEITPPRARWQMGYDDEDGFPVEMLNGSPIPLSLPFEKGVPLKVVVVENDIKITFTATSLLTGDDHVRHPQQ